MRLTGRWRSLKASWPMRSERERRLGMTEKASRWRYTLVVAFVVLSLGGQAIRLVMLQAWPDQIRIDSINRARQLVKDLSVERGAIVDCHGRVLAMDVFQGRVRRPGGGGQQPLPAGCGGNAC